MGDQKQETTMEHRVTALERDLLNHITTCERNGREMKWVLRLVAALLITYAVKVVFHIPVG